MICVSVAHIAFSELQPLVKELEMMELRMDFLKFSDQEYQELIDSKKPIIATYRYGTVSDNVRKKHLQKLIEMGATYVDIEIDASDAFVSEMLEFAQKHQCKTILSYHNFEGTPEVPVLEEIIDKSKQLGGDYTKIVTKADEESDAGKVLSLYDNPKHKNLIAFAMGEPGTVSRLTSLAMGAEFTYAALSKDKATACGQLDYKTLKELIDLTK
jgi:3-dehydroquinate dehydratase type I